jgi:hypothetical protein
MLLLCISLVPILNTQKKIGCKQDQVYSNAFCS